LLLLLLPPLLLLLLLAEKRTVHMPDCDTNIQCTNLQRTLACEITQGQRLPQ